ncbi:MAG: hypothetical protein OXH52_15615 [Gammaproteobacteria bacterium]|nr:hypothetical protein [Gammaproteobacteria bacterium]
MAPRWPAAFAGAAEDGLHSMLAASRATFIAGEGAPFCAKREWERLDDRNASRDCYAHSIAGSHQSGDLAAMIEWLCWRRVRLEEAFAGPLRSLNR